MLYLTQRVEVVYSPAQSVEMKCKSSRKASALMKIMISDLNLPVVFQISIPLLSKKHSLSKNHMHIVVQLRGGNNGALGFLRSKDYFLFNWIVGKYLLQFS